MARPIQLYAELLRNIDTINVFVYLEHDSTKDISATLSEDGSEFKFRCGAQSCILQLPARAASQQSRSLTVPTVNDSKELGFRLKLERSEASRRRDNYGKFEASSPWSAPALKELECIHCAQCRRNLIRPLTIKTWKDLPSENWAEMMEFWHCHKPNVENSSENSSSKGYSASSRIVAEPSIGLVDTTSFLLCPKDCRSAEIQHTSGIECQSTIVACSGCGHVLGYVDQKSSGWRIFKSAVAAGIHPRSVFLQHYPLEKWIAALLISAIEVQASKKFVVHNGTASGERLMIWIFTSHLNVAYSTTDTKAISACVMKIFWKTIGAVDADETTTAISGENVDLPLPQYFSPLKTALLQNQSILPPSARKYQDWDVSLLHCFNDNDIKGIN